MHRARILWCGEAEIEVPQMHTEERQDCRQPVGAGGGEEDPPLQDSDWVPGSILILNFRPSELWESNVRPYEATPFVAFVLVSLGESVVPLNCGVGEDSLRVPCTARRSNQSILKEISPEYSLEGLMLKLKLQYFGHLMLRTDSLEKTLMLGKIEGGRRGGWDGWVASLTQWTWLWASSGIWWWIGRPGVQRFMGSQRVGHDWVTELNWTEETGMLL